MKTACRLTLLCWTCFCCAAAAAQDPRTVMNEARALAHHVTAARGGEGAAREFCDLLLMACGRYPALLEAQLQGGAATLDAR